MLSRDTGHEQAALHHSRMSAPTSRPKGVLAATAALNISPVARWHKQCSSLILGDWVPLPQPGGPAHVEIQAQAAHGYVSTPSKGDSGHDAKYPQDQRITDEDNMLLGLCCTVDASLYFFNEFSCWDIF